MTKPDFSGRSVMKSQFKIVVIQKKNKYEKTNVLQIKKHFCKEQKW